MESFAVRFTDVSLIRDSVSIVTNLNVSIQRGESWTILGRNGAGKTTLINLLYGYLWPTSGEISVLGTVYGESPLAPIQKKIGILQVAHQELLTQKNLTTWEVVVTGLIVTLGLYIEVSNELKSQALTMLDSIGMREKANLPYSQLSSGEKTKVLLLRAMGEGKEILILDEPSAALDLTARMDFQTELKKTKIKNPSLTRILITHRVEEIPNDFTHVMLIKEGKILAKGKKQEILNEENLSNLYDLELHVHESNETYFISSK